MLTFSQELVTWTLSLDQYYICDLRISFSSTIAPRIMQYYEYEKCLRFIIFNYYLQRFNKLTLGHMNHYFLFLKIFLQVTTKYKGAKCHNAKNPRIYCTPCAVRAEVCFLNFMKWDIRVYSRVRNLKTKNLVVL